MLSEQLAFLINISLDKRANKTARFFLKVVVFLIKQPDFFWIFFYLTFIKQSDFFFLFALKSDFLGFFFYYYFLLKQTS